MERGFELPPFFWRKVKKGKGCWEWTGYKDKDGYGRMRFRARPEGCHRLILMSLGHDVRGRVMRHSCDNPSCVNPSHLLIGTQRDNIRDREERGRRRGAAGLCGEEHYGSKLTAKKVEQMRKEYANLRAAVTKKNVAKGSVKHLAAKYGISTQQLSKIVCGAQWVQKIRG